MNKIQIEESGVVYELDSFSQTAVVCGSHDNLMSVVIQGQIKYNRRVYHVVEIGNQAFKNQKNLTNITFPECVRNISGKAFVNCTSLESIILPHNLKLIGDYAFSGCVNLISLTIPTSLTKIGYLAFDNCNKIKIIHISSLEAWFRVEYDTKHGYGWSPFGADYKLFLDDEEVTDLVVPNSIVSINNDAFNGCISLISVSFPHAIKEIGKYAFSSCNKLKKVLISDLKKWYSIRFGNIESNPLSFAHRLFVNGLEVQSLDIPNNITKIKPFIFAGMYNLKDIKMHNKLTEIGRDAFNGCTRLKSLDLPKSVKSIGDYAFCGCSNISLLVIPESVRVIGMNAFSTIDNLKSVLLPKSLQIIGNNAFEGCKGLTSIIIPEGVSKIGREAFRDCGLITVIISKTVQTIGEGVFYGCDSLEHVFCMASTPPTICCYYEGVDKDLVAEKDYQKMCDDRDDLMMLEWMGYPDEIEEDETTRAILHVPASSIGAYKSSSRWGNFFQEIVPL